MYDQTPPPVGEPTLESLINNMRESRDRIYSATNSTTEQIYRLGFAQSPPAAPDGATTGTGFTGPGRERTAIERLIELADQLQSAATDCEWNHKNLQKQF